MIYFIVDTRKLLLTFKDCIDNSFLEIIGSYCFAKNNCYIVNATNYYES
jgi:hypothetical protein